VSPTAVRAGVPAMSTRQVIDVSALPDYAFGPRAILWWGVLGLIAIEGTLFVLVIGSYFYLRLYVPDWPPFRIDPPGIGIMTAQLVVLLLAIVPWAVIDKLARREAPKADLLA